MPSSNEQYQLENLSREKDIQRVFINIPVLCIKKTEPLNEHEKSLATEDGLLGLPLLKKNTPDVEKNFHETFDFDLLAEVLTKHCIYGLIVGRDFDEAIKILRRHSTYHFYYLMVEVSIAKSQLKECDLDLKIQKNTLIEPSGIISVRPIDINHYNVSSTFSGIYLTNIDDIWPGSLLVTNPHALQKNAFLAVMAKTELTPSQGTHSFFSREVDTVDEATAAKLSSIKI